MHDTTHTPVLLAETLAYLKVRPGGTYLDGTIGGGGHAEAILAASAPDGVVIGLDRDPTALKRVTARLAGAGSRLRVRQASYDEAPDVAQALRLPAVDGILLDLGLSSDQLADPQRGFSFQTTGPLDLRFDPSVGESAAALLADLSPRELTQILGDYGELRAPHRLAERMIAWRDTHGMTTTEDLLKASGLIDPRRRAQLFQALRIAVNDELGTIARALPKLWGLLVPGGRLVVLTFHSLEDRIVKTQFRQWQAAGAGTISTKKPVLASGRERANNPRSRSAKLRAIEKR